MRSTTTKSAGDHSTPVSSSISFETTQEQQDGEIHTLEPPRQRSFRRRSYPARSNSIDHQEVPKILPCHSTSDASTSTATTEACPSLADYYARRSKKDPIVSPFKRFRRAKRRSSIATESTAHLSGETAPASFDSQGDVLHKHMHYGTPRTTTPSLSSSSSSSLPKQGDIAPVPPPLQHQQHTSFVHPQKETMKRHRRDKTATFGMVGAGVGTLLLPVVGTVVGGVLSGYAANQSLKRYEKKIQRKWEREEFQRTASASQTARHAVFV